ncbi:hypothetical protein ACJJTC_015918 [Scirpophaga incertulas]
MYTLITIIGRSHITACIAHTRGFSQGIAETSQKALLLYKSATPPYGLPTSMPAVVSFADVPVQLKLLSILFRKDNSSGVSQCSRRPNMSLVRHNSCDTGRVFMVDTDGADETDDGDNVTYSGVTEIDQRDEKLLQHLRECFL